MIGNKFVKLRREFNVKLVWLADKQQQQQRQRQRQRHRQQN